MTTFSVAIATYNGSKYLRQQLDSIAEQSVKPSEIVACDDGSNDATLDILADFARTVSFPVRVERNAQQLGVSENFMRAASLCQGKWICFCDQDDVWLPRKLEFLREHIAARPNTRLIAHRAALVDEELRHLGELLHVPNVNRVAVIPRLSRGFWGYPYGFTMAFDAKLLRRVPAQGRPFSSHDRWIAILASVLGDTVYLPDVLALYRRHGANYSSLNPASGPLQTIQNLDPHQFAIAAPLVGALADHLQRAVTDATDADSELLEEASMVYRRLSWALGERGRLWEETSSMPARAIRYAQLIRLGGYTHHRAGGLGWRAALRDAASVLLYPNGSQSAR